MQFPESWLREFCNPPIDTAALADLLTMAGMEVEEMRKAAPPFTDVVVAEVLSVERHPNADKLNVCRVDVGVAVPLSIVCGAPNVRVGIKVPCALIGATLPPTGDDAEPFRITLGLLRGVESQGMLCSARELKLSDDHGGLLVLADTAVVGQDIRRHLSLDDTLFTLKLTPNLGHCLSVYGIAREVSALTGAPLNEPTFVTVTQMHDASLPVRIEAADLCGRFTGRIVRNVNPRAATPQWMVDRLARCGQRSVTALVDISNYVMFEFGRPSHIFDLDKIHGGLCVRWGRAGESLKLLNGNTIEVDAQVGVIADDKSVESLAGIMGGDATAVSDETRHVFVEAAFWWPQAVAGRSRRFGFSTEAGHRFERGVDPATTPQHIERITQLIIDICGGEPGPLQDQALRAPERKPVAMRVARAAKVIGMPVSEQQCAGVFRRLGLPFTAAAGVLTATPPSWRFDLQIEEDLIEEVIRVVGFDKLPDSPPVAPVVARMRTEQQRSAHAVRRAMADLDYAETLNFSFVEERWERELAGNTDPIRVLNPIASPLSVMRTSLLGSLLQVLRYNLARKGTRVRIFEVGRVFIRDPLVMEGPLTVAGIHQPLRLAGLAHGSADTLQWGNTERAVDFFDVKGDIEALFAPVAVSFTPAEHPAMHPGRCARVTVNGQGVGFVGELHPKWRQGYELPSAPLMFEIELSAVLQRPMPLATPIARQQAVWRDIAVIAADDVTHARLMAAIHATPQSLVRSAHLFDIYKPKLPSSDIGVGERSLAVRLELLDDAVTLTDERIEVAVTQVLNSLAARLGARLRS